MDFVFVPRFDDVDKFAERFQQQTTHDLCQIDFVFVYIISLLLFSEIL